MKINMRLEGLDCANCAGKIEKAVSKMNGVSNCSLAFMTQKLSFDVEDGLKDAVLSEIPKVVGKYEAHVKVKRI